MDSYRNQQKKKIIFGLIWFLAGLIITLIIRHMFIVSNLMMLWGVYRISKSSYQYKMNKPIEIDPIANPSSAKKVQPKEAQWKDWYNLKTIRVICFVGFIVAFAHVSVLSFTTIPSGIYDDIGFTFLGLAIGAWILEIRTKKAVPASVNHKNKGKDQKI